MIMQSFNTCKDIFILNLITIRDIFIFHQLKVQNAIDNECQNYKNRYFEAH